MLCTEAELIDQSVNIPLKQSFQRSNGILSVRTHGRKSDGGASYDTKRHDTQQALGIHLAVIGLDPDAAVELISLLNKICSLTVMQAGLTANDDFFIKHTIHLLMLHPRSQDATFYHL